MPAKKNPVKKTVKKSVKKNATKEIVKKTAPEIITLPEKLEKVLLSGDLSVLKAEERIEYYNNMCKSVGLNPLTKPFEYIVLNNRLTLYARKDATDQLRKKWGVSVYNRQIERDELGGLYTYTAYLQDAAGRKDIGTGVVNIKGLHGDNLANAIMKAETKAKRRGTLSICGLGMLDETELETIPGADKVTEEIRQPKNVTPEKPAVKPESPPPPQSTPPAEVSEGTSDTQDAVKEVPDEKATRELKAFVESFDWTGKDTEYGAVVRTLDEGVSTEHAENIKSRIKALNLPKFVEIY